MLLYSFLFSTFFKIFLKFVDGEPDLFVYEGNGVL